MTDEEIRDRALEALAWIRQQSLEELRSQLDERGSDNFAVDSLEAVAVLEELAEATGINPEDPEIVKACGVQHLQGLVDLIARFSTGS